LSRGRLFFSQGPGSQKKKTRSPLPRQKDSNSRSLHFSFSYLNILKQKPLTLFFAAGFLHNLAFVGNYSYFTAHLKFLEISEAFIAGSWALAPVGEIFIFRYGKKILHFISYEQLFKLSLLTAAIRWGLLAFLEKPWLIAMTQVSHALAFGGFYLSAMVFLHHAFPENWRSVGQGLFSGICFSLAMVLGNLIMGLIFEWGGTHAIFLCCTFCSVGATLLAYQIPKEPRPTFPDRSPE